MRKNTFVCQLFFIGDSEGTADYVISITESWMTPTILMTLTFVVSALLHSLQELHGEPMRLLHQSVYRWL